MYRVPGKVVAEALFDALIEYEANLPKYPRMREVHVVDVNTDNINALKTVLFCKFRQFEQTQVQ